MLLEVEPGNGVGKVQTGTVETLQREIAEEIAETGDGEGFGG